MKVIVANLSFGTLIEGQTKEIESYVTNQSDSACTIRISTSCKCITTNPHVIYINNGERKKYTIKIAPTRSGPYSEYLIVQSDKRELYKITLTANVIHK